MLTNTGCIQIIVALPILHVPKWTAILVSINTLVVKVLGTPVGGQGGSLWTLTQKMHFPKEFFDQTRYIKTTLKH